LGGRRPPEEAVPDREIGEAFGAGLAMPIAAVRPDALEFEDADSPGFMSNEWKRMKGRGKPEYCTGPDIRSRAEKCLPGL